VVKFFFLVIYIFSTQVLATDCTGLKDGEVIRLDDPGKSLENFQVQDQDGLNTCASNATSLLMHSILDDHPSLSYIQLAAINKNEAAKKYREDLLKNKSQGFDAYARENNKNWDLMIDYGNICEILKAAQNYQKESGGGICKSASVNIEKLVGGKDGGAIQKKSLLAVSKYMNEFQKNFGELDRPEATANNKLVRKKYQDFKLAFEKQLKNKEVLHSQECKKINSDMLTPVLNSMSSYFLTFDHCFSKKPNQQKICQLINKVMTVKTLPDGGMVPSYSESFKNSFMLSLSEDASLKSTDVRAKLHASLEKIHGEKFDSDTEQFMQWMADDIRPSDEQKIVDEINDIKKSGFSRSCSERKLMNYLMSDDLKTDAKKDTVLCSSSKLIENIRDVVSTTANQGLLDSKRVQDFLLKNANLNLEPAMMSLYAYDCSEGDKVKLPETLKCAEYPVNLDTKDAVNGKIIYKLKNNQALGATICLSILKKPKSEFKDKECGLHDVGIIGVQCKSGKLKYLIQNSWGLNNQSENSAIETDGSGKGSYWFDETSFFDGVSKIQSVSK
jgi:hypothetical protein